MRLLVCNCNTGFLNEIGCLVEQTCSSGASAGSSDSGILFIESHCGGGSVAVSLLCVQQPAANGLLQYPKARHML
jgi:hypothetical protein